MLIYIGGIVAISALLLIIFYVRTKRVSNRQEELQEDIGRIEDDLKVIYNMEKQCSNKECDNNGNNIC